MIKKILQREMASFLCTPLGVCCSGEHDNNSIHFHLVPLCTLGDYSKVSDSVLFRLSLLYYALCIEIVHIFSYHRSSKKSRSRSSNADPGKYFGSER